MTTFRDSYDWFWSDLHFDHANIIAYTDRPYADVPEMNAAIIDNFNSVVGHGDDTLLVGDIAMGKRDQSLTYLDYMVGHHPDLVLGNHDHPFPANKKSDKAFPLYQQYFRHIGISTTLEIAGQTVNVCHFPYEGDSHDADRFDRFRLPNDGRWILHGHTHAAAMHTEPKQIHVGFDADWTYYGVERYHPIPLSAVEAFIEEHS